MTKHIALATLLAALGASVTWSSAASANCARPAGYHIAVENNAVTICPSNHGHRACPDSGGMLRENRASKEVVELAAFCSGTGYSGPCYLDECVPPGTYRYGFATPYDCCASCCSTDYFQQITVEAPLPQGCTRTPGNDAPQAFAGSIPWGDDRTICEYGVPARTVVPPLTMAMTVAGVPSRSLRRTRCSPSTRWR